MRISSPQFFFEWIVGAIVAFFLVFVVVEGPLNRDKSNQSKTNKQ